MKPSISVLRSDFHGILQQHMEELLQFRARLIEAAETAQSEEEKAQILFLFEQAGLENTRALSRGKYISDLAPKMLSKLRVVK